MQIRKVGVLGCGLMGSGIAQVSAQAGFPTIVREVSDDFLKKGLSKIDGFLAKSVEKGKATAEDRASVMGLLKGTTRLEDLADCDLVIEAIVRSRAQARDVRRADRICRKQAIFAATRRPSDHGDDNPTGRHDRFLALQSGPLMKLVEVVRRSRAPRRGRRCDGVRPASRKDADLAAVRIHRQPSARSSFSTPSARSRRESADQDIDAGMSSAAKPDGPLTLLDLGWTRPTHREHLVRRVPRASFRPTAAAQADGARGLPGKEERQGLLRLLEEPPVRTWSGGTHPCLRTF